MWLTASNVRQRYGFSQIELLASLAIVAVLISLLLQAVQSARESARKMACSNNFKQVGIALLDFEAAHRSFPANDALAWTQRILAQTEGSRNFSLPLSSVSHEEQERFLNHCPAIFRCPAASSSAYVPYPKASSGINYRLPGMRMAQILDGNSNTLLIGELQAGLSAPWVQGPTASELYFSSDHKCGAHLTLVDGSVHFLSLRLDVSTLESLLSPDGGEVVQQLN